MRFCKFFNCLEKKKSILSCPEAQEKVILGWKTPFSKSFQPEKFFNIFFFKREWREQHSENGERVS